mgnify:CR=1 FL=1
MPVGVAARIVACDAGEERVCRFNRGGLRFRHGPRCGKARLFMGGRKQTTVPDELEARGEHVADGAPDELADVQRQSAFVPRGLVSHPACLIMLAIEDALIRDSGAPWGSLETVPFCRASSN